MLNATASVAPSVLRVVAPEAHGPDWATIVTAVSTVVLAAVTLALVLYTKRLADVTSRPVVVVTLEPSPVTNMYFYMRVANEGTASAHDVRIELSPGLTPRDQAKWTNSPFPTVSILRPGQVLEAIACRYADLAGKTIEVNASWTGRPQSRKRTTTAYPLAMSDYQHFGTFIEGDLGTVTKELKGINESLSNALRGMSRVGVDIFDRSDRVRESEEREQQYERMAEMLDQAQQKGSASPSDD